VIPTIGVPPPSHTRVTFQILPPPQTGTPVAHGKVGGGGAPGGLNCHAKINETPWCLVVVRLGPTIIRPDNAGVGHRGPIDVAAAIMEKR
jgi:hypothetical protein